jgi:cell wall assembly regulator SMI1
VSEPNEQSPAFARVVRWLEAHAPRTRAALLPCPARAELESLAAELQCELPAGIAHLYASCGGQSLEAPAGLCDGYTLMPLHGVDGLETAWAQMRQAHEAGAEWATENRYAFAKDFSGAYLCVEMDGEEGVPGRIIRIEDDTTTELAADMESYLEALAGRLERGEFQLDDTIETVEDFAVAFDAARARTPGEAATHPVFTQLGIEARVESIESHASPFDTVLPRHGFYVRLVARDNDIRVAATRLEDARGRSFGTGGHGSGGGKPGFFVFVTSMNPIPPGSRLYVTLQRSRRS